MTLKLQSYTAPEWAEDLSGIPKHKVSLAMLNTPIQRWNLPGLPDGVELFIKRDDMTGSILSGNKIRKLEFLFADAIQKGCKHFITCGGIQSNFCRAVSSAGAQLGLKVHLILRGDVKQLENATCIGNLLLDQLCGAQMYFVPNGTSYENGILPRMKQIAQNIKDKTGEDSYLTEFGGSDSVGFYGYLEAFRELQSQGVLDQFDDVVHTAGSGGTGEGLAAGNFLTGSKIKLHSMCICDDAEYFYSHANETFKTIKLGAKAEDVMNAIDKHVGGGYGIANEDDFAFIAEVAQKTGVVLDLTYTGKSVHGLVKELRNNPGQFKGKRILFIHTGGIFGCFDGRLGGVAEKDSARLENLHMWTNLEDSPLK